MPNIQMMIAKKLMSLLTIYMTNVKTMGKNKSFEFRSEWLDIIHSLEKESQLAVFDALACKMLGRRCPALSKQQRSVIDTIIQLSKKMNNMCMYKIGICE